MNRSNKMYVTKIDFAHNAKFQGEKIFLFGGAPNKNSVSSLFCISMSYLSGQRNILQALLGIRTVAKKRHPIPTIKM